MSDKFFFKGRKTPKPKHQSFGYNTNRSSKIGTQERPFNLSVQTKIRADELNALIEAQDLVVSITIDNDQPENIEEWTYYNQRPIAVTVAKKLGRNEPCSCGSGKKYKSCCG